ncbi:NYN domain-containing protein [Candidatus Kaiserbacteria bacterium]|nr:NYN domain-containing protein [Candidatus Kaiserbacteria bacterium]
MAIIKHSEQRVGVFIDTQNLYHSAKNIYHARVNFGNVLKDSVAGRRLIRARAYMVTTESGEETAFIEALTKVGIEPKTKELQVFYGGAKKADWDVGMAVDAITASPNLDAVILITGDGDFVPLVQYLQMHAGCQVEVVSFGRSTSGKLREATDNFLDLDEDPRRYLLNYRPVRGSGRNVRGPATRPAGRDIQVSAPDDSIAEQAAEGAAEAGKITGVE